MNVGGGAAVSWSGGKDCCLALHRARAAGMDVRALVAMFDETGERTRSHAVPRGVMEAQAGALGLELVAPSASWASYEAAFVEALQGLRERGIRDIVFGDIDLAPHREWEEKVCAAAGVMEAQAGALGLELVAPSASWASYEAAFVEALQGLRERGIRDIVFGDIDLAPHREWEEKVCAAAGVSAHLPLWLEPRDELAREVLALGYRPIVVCTDDRWLGAEFAGRAYDAAFLNDLPPGVDACGENGEFHTFVLDGPGFRTPVPVRVTSVESRHVPFGERSYVYHYARLALARERE